MSESTYGTKLQTTRIARGLSIKKLAKQSGISRRHIGSAERGLNISVSVLKRLMHALGLTHIDLGEGISASASSAVMSSEVTDVLGDLQRSMELTQSIVTKIRSFEQRVGKSIPNDSPEDEDDVVARASALIGEFTTYVRSIRNPAELAGVEKGLSGLLSTKGATAPASRRRKRTA